MEKISASPETGSETQDEKIEPVAICVPAGDELVVISFEEIIYLESDDNYCRIYCLKHTHPYTTRITLKEISKLLPVKSFQRIHESYIVAEKIIKRFNSCRTRLYVGADKWLPVSRRHRKILMQLFPTAVSK